MRVLSMIVLETWTRVLDWSKLSAKSLKKLQKLIRISTYRYLVLLALCGLLGHEETLRWLSIMLKLWLRLHLWVSRLRIAWLLLIIEILTDVLGFNSFTILALRDLMVFSILIIFLTSWWVLSCLIIHWVQGCWRCCKQRLMLSTSSQV